jgi:hypothetical protein
MGDSKAFDRKGRKGFAKNAEKTCDVRNGVWRNAGATRSGLELGISQEDL